MLRDRSSCLGAQTARTGGQGCSRRVESSRAPHRAGNTANVTWQCPDTVLACSGVPCHCQHCHLPTCEGQGWNAREWESSWKKRSREVGERPWSRGSLLAQAVRAQGQITPRDSWIFPISKASVSPAPQHLLKAEKVWELTHSFVCCSKQQHLPG